jgi:hypothetical protein
MRRSVIDSRHLKGYVQGASMDITIKLPLAEGIAVDLYRHGVWRDRVFRPLSAHPYCLLGVFLRYPNRVLAESYLLHEGWLGEIRERTDLYPMIYRVRMVVERDPHHPRMLLNRRDMGYSLNIASKFLAEWPSDTPNILQNLLHTPAR